MSPLLPTQSIQAPVFLSQSDPIPEKKHTFHLFSPPFFGTMGSKSKNKISPEFVKTNIGAEHTIGTEAKPFFIVYKDEAEDYEDDVSEDFIVRFNSHIGNMGNMKKAERLIAKMKMLADLEPKTEEMITDIPSARLGLGILAGLNYPKYKMEALESLLLLLENDTMKKDSSVKLVRLAINLMNRMNPELIQTEILDTQITISKVYSVLTELLLRHYAKKHINSVTRRFKIELINTIRALEFLNTQDDRKLDFYVNLALSGTRRLQHGGKALFTLLGRLYHAGAAAVSIPTHQIGTALDMIDQTFKDLDPHLPDTWFNGVLLLNEFGRGVESDVGNLKGLQLLVAKKYQIFDWKFSYAALLQLADITIHAESYESRKLSFNGIKALGASYPGLATFANLRDLQRQVNFKDIIRLKRHRFIDTNKIIRESCIEHLIRIAEESPDKEIRKRAKLILIRRLRLEKQEDIIKILNEKVPALKQDQNRWLKEIDESGDPLTPQGCQRSLSDFVD